MKDNDMPPDAAAELRLLRAEIAALRDHVTQVAAVPRVPVEWPAAAMQNPVEAMWTAKTGAAKWLPTVQDGHLMLPEQHYRLLGWLQHGVKSGSSLWWHHPQVRTGSELTFGERAADVMRSAFGSWMFVGSFLTFMALWMVLNSVFLKNSAFDVYPYILLNLCLSMMAGLQGALILIAAKRADRVSAEQALAHYAETGKLDELQTENNVMTARIEEATSLLAEIHEHVSALSPLAGEFPSGKDDEPGVH